MRHMIWTFAVLSSVACGVGTARCWAQQPTGMNSTPRSPFANTGYNRPTVSPYINLGTNSNGLSNYQTLVKPMIDDRQALERQNAALSQLQRQRGIAPQSNPRDADPNGRQGVRYFHYSHYYNKPGQR